MLVISTSTTVVAWGEVRLLRTICSAIANRMRLGPGTLYSSLQSLLEEGLIEEIDSPDEASDNRRRRMYRLTTAGRKLARSEADRLADLLRVARARKIFKGDYV